MGSLAAHDGSWVFVIGWIVLAFSAVLSGLSIIWKRALALPAMYLITVLATMWLASLARQKWTENTRVNDGALFLAAGLTGISVLNVIGFHKSLGKNPPQPSSFWWWFGLRG